MKTKEELNALKQEVEAMSQKLAELSEEELTQVVGGIGLKKWIEVSMVNNFIEGNSADSCGGAVYSGHDRGTRAKRMFFPVEEPESSADAENCTIYMPVDK